MCQSSLGDFAVLFTDQRVDNSISEQYMLCFSQNIRMKPSNIKQISTSLNPSLFGVMDNVLIVDLLRWHSPMPQKKCEMTPQ
jgi:hypothetical protein